MAFFSASFPLWQGVKEIKYHLTPWLLLIAYFFTQEVAMATPKRYQNTFVGVRPAAMGNAFTAVADDANALYYNPAGLARLETWNLDLISLIVGVNNATAFNSASVAELAQAGKSTGGSSDPSQIIDDLRPVLNELSGENHYARIGLNPSFVMRRFGIGLYAGTELELVPHANALPTALDVSVLTDGQARIGYAHHFFGQKLAVGATLNGYLRAEATLDDFGIFEVADAAGDSKALQEQITKNFHSGWGVGTDLGILFTPVELWKPTFGLVVKDIGDTNFRYYRVIKNSEYAAPPSPVRQTVNTGVSITPQWGSYYVRPSLDFREINLPIPASKKLGLGFEAGIKGNYLKGSVQTGLSEGYFTAGFEADLFLLALRYATYVSDRGTFPTEKPERRHVIQLKVLL